MNAAAEILRAAEHVEDALDALRRALAKLDAEDAPDEVDDLLRAIRWANGCPISLRSLARCVEETAA
jgi:NAD(P)H-dependent FMN reductase